MGRQGVCVHLPAVLQQDHRIKAVLPLALAGSFSLGPDWSGITGDLPGRGSYRSWTPWSASSRGGPGQAGTRTPSARCMEEVTAHGPALDREGHKLTPISGPREPHGQAEAPERWPPGAGWGRCFSRWSNPWKHYQGDAEAGVQPPFCRLHLRIEIHLNVMALIPKYSSPPLRKAAFSMAQCQHQPPMNSINI
uniref:Mediator complex subunit 22 n=1 Tax=Rousettus aegyptiacus TaxID=9407 RepID=A0A7J8INK4_ROUAE|nr:mediator complex subunit 22 [Rousettus aegyptiacus]